jgi:hypothetical protein
VLSNVPKNHELLVKGDHAVLIRDRIFRNETDKSDRLSE